MTRQTVRRYIGGIFCGLLLTAIAGGASAQTPKVNTHDASIPKATKTTKANMRKAGGTTSKNTTKVTRRVGKSLSQVGRNIQKQTNRTVGKKP